MRPWVYGPLLLSGALGWLACDGDARRADDDDGSTSAAGGGATTSGGGGAADCADGGACFLEGTTCTDNGCCPCAYECQGGEWKVTECAGCALPPCEEEPPQDGAPCDRCGPPACSYQQCEGAGLIDAQCVAEGSEWYWQVQATPCR